MSRRPTTFLLVACLAGFLLLGDALAPPAAAESVRASGGESASSAAAETDPPAESDGWSLLFVFVLSTFIGIGVIGGVSRLLHTPLMSLTNAISAIAIVGAILVTGQDHPVPIRIMAAVALFASTTNIVSGFLITDRMLKMFKETRKNPEGQGPKA